MVDDIKAMSKDLFNAPQGAGASLISGGTESVFMALKTARDNTPRDRNDPYDRYSVVTCITVHACLDKLRREAGIG